MPEAPYPLFVVNGVSFVPKKLNVSLPLCPHFPRWLNISYLLFLPLFRNVDADGAKHSIVFGSEVQTYIGETVVGCF
ncbi:hypothetical protein CXF95_12795 [Paraglaciecola sp. MB-3u-78]|nr:hypothetical protein CXF95_12795 [Paraglaciecola sp. MB-3u-78]